MAYDMTTLNGADKLGDPEHYFRLNILGMGRARATMEALGMVHYHDEALPPMADYNGHDDRLDEAYRTGGRKAMLDLYYSFDPHWSWAPECPGMAGWKFCSNDPWLVTPIEIHSALELWKERSADVTGGLPESWQEWISFLRRCEANGGMVQG